MIISCCPYKQQLADAAVDSAYRYAYAYAFDGIGNHNSSAECGVQRAEYMSNELNQYTNIEYSAVSPATCHLSPTYDADGNQTLVKTATGIWQVTYNGENRPILWTCGETNIVMSFDRMGRRVTKNDQHFVYNGYLQIANFHSPTPTQNSNYYIWDPTEPVATRPLVWQHQAPGTLHQAPLFYTHDGNKNVSEVIASDGALAAHYEYAPFGALTLSRGTSAEVNPFRFSSEYAEDDTATVYYNYRHYEPATGRWMSRDPMEEKFKMNAYDFIRNRLCCDVDLLGLIANSIDSEDSICVKAVAKARKEDPEIKSIEKKIGDLKKRLPSWDHSCDLNFKCECCGNYFSREGGTFYDNSHLVRICSDGYLRKKDNGTLDDTVKETLHHELLHALQRCKGAKTSTCRQSMNIVKIIIIGNGEVC